MGKGNGNIVKYGKKTQFKSGDAKTKEASAKSAVVRQAQAALRSSEAIVQADKDGTLANMFWKMVDAANELFEQGKFDSYLKHSAAILEMVNGKQINLKADANVKRNINIVFRRATPADAK